MAEESLDLADVSGFAHEFEADCMPPLIYLLYPGLYSMYVMGGQGWQDR